RFWSPGPRCRQSGCGSGSGDEAKQNPGLTGGVTILRKAFLLLEVPYRRSCVRAVDAIDRTRVRGGLEQQALQVPDRVAGSTLGQVRAWSERESVGVERGVLAVRDGPSYSVCRWPGRGGLEGSQRGLRVWPEDAVYGTGTEETNPREVNEVLLQGRLQQSDGVALVTLSEYGLVVRTRS